MFDEPWPETVAGWEFTRSDSLERYRRQLTNGVTVGARWDVERQRGQVRAYVQPAGSGRTLSSSREEFRSEEAMWTAARMVLDMAANLPSFRTGDESPAQSVLFGDVAGNVEVKPGCGGEPDAELTFTLTDGRSVTVVLTEEQADAMESGICSVREHVWSEYDTEEDGTEEDGTEEDGTEDDGTEDDSTEEDEDEDTYEDEQEEPVPDVTGVDSGPDTGHELIMVLEKRFGVTEDFLMAHVDWSAVVVVGEPAVSALVERADELREAIAPRWWPGLLERPGENWVVLSRA